MTQNQIKYWTLLEEKRHNVATEGETKRHNLVDEGETYRSNTVREYETMRHNKETERISALEQAETKRHNIVYEQETNRHNLATEGESIRHNKEQEALGWANVNLGYATLSESHRHNVIQEAISTREVAVKEQQNVLRAQELDETIRHDKSAEMMSHESNLAKMATSGNPIIAGWAFGEVVELDYYNSNSRQPRSGETRAALNTIGTGVIGYDTWQREYEERNKKIETHNYNGTQYGGATR